MSTFQIGLGHRSLCREKPVGWPAVGNLVVGLHRWPGGLCSHNLRGIGLLEAGARAYSNAPAGTGLVEEDRGIPFSSGSLEVGPFATAGTYHIYCAVHQGMNLTIIVR